eukprot:gene7949-1165_t
MADRSILRSSVSDLNYSQAQGNAAFSAGEYDSAIDFFSQAVELDPTNHVLYSNRSAAKASVKDYDGALEDAKACVSLKPEWAKGYSRLGAAHFGLKSFDSAIEAYEKGLTIDPSNAQLKEGLEDSKDAQDGPPPLGGMGGGLFNSPDMMSKLAMDPRTRGLIGNPGFMAMFADVQKNPTNMSKYMSDPNFQLLMEVTFGLKMSTGAEFGEEFGSKDAKPGGAAPKPSSPEPAPQSAPEVEMDDAEKMKTENKKLAVKEKELGNAAYKVKDFPTAIAHYNKAIELDDSDISFLTNKAKDIPTAIPHYIKAIELDDSDISFLTNKEVLETLKHRALQHDNDYGLSHGTRSAAHFEAKEFEDCITVCDQAVDHGREIRADYKLLAKALARKGQALVKLERLEEAIAIFNKSLMEHRNADTLKKLQETEKLLKDKIEQAYVDLELADEEKEKGNTAFKEMRYPEAVKHYQESLKRGPGSVYSNLAASYTKLGAYPEGVKAVDKCIELNPTFAIETFKTGLQYDPENAELAEGMNKCYAAISRFASGQASKEEIAERQQRSMSDPEVQSLLQDPVMQNVHLKNPGIMAKINKLVAAGIIQVK